MNILFLVDGFPAISETFILNQIVALKNKGCKIDILAKRSSDRRKIHPEVHQYHLLDRTFYYYPSSVVRAILLFLLLFPVYLVKKPCFTIQSLNIFRYGTMALSLRLFYAFRFSTKQALDYDVIHCHYAQNGVIAAYLKNIGVVDKFITTFHGYDINANISRLTRRGYRTMFDACPLYTANTEYTKNRAADLGFPSKKIAVLPMGLDLQKYDQTQTADKAADTVNLLSVGRLVEKKGYEYSIQAFAQLSQQYDNLQYTIIGRGPLQHSLQALVEDLGVQDRISFKGAMDFDEVLSCYRKADIFVLSSVTASNGDKEGQGLVLQEAQAVGLPVVSTYHNGIPEGLLENESGFLVPEKDVAQLAEKIASLIEGPQLRQKMGQAGRTYVRDKYEINTLASKLYDLYCSA